MKRGIHPWPNFPPSYVIVYSQLEPLNITYARPLVVMGKTYPDALRAYLARANERSLDDYPLPDWQAYLDVHRAKFHDPELRPALLSAGYDDLWAWTEFGRSLMVVRDELLLEDMDSIDEAWEVAVPSREMRDYWKAKNLKGIQLFEVIASAPIPLEKKVELLKKFTPIPRYRQGYQKEVLHLPDRSLCQGAPG